MADSPTKQEIAIVLDLQNQGWRVVDMMRVSYNGKPALRVNVERNGERSRIFCELARWDR